MDALEKKIEKAACRYANTYDNIYGIHGVSVDSFIDGAKSPEAKEYWQQDMLEDIDSLKEVVKGYQEAIDGMYTKERVISLLGYINDDLPDLYSRFNPEYELLTWESNHANS